MNNVQELACPESTVFESFDSLIKPLLEQNVPKVFGFFIAAFAGSYLADKTINTTCKLEDFSFRRKMSAATIMAVSCLVGGYFADQCTLFQIPEAALKVEKIADTVSNFKYGIVATVFGSVMLNKAKLIPFMYLSAASYFSMRPTLLITTAFGAWLGLGLNYSQSKKGL